MSYLVGTQAVGLQRVCQGAVEQFVEMKFEGKLEQELQRRQINQSVWKVMSKTRHTRVHAHVCSVGMVPVPNRRSSPRLRLFVCKARRSSRQTVMNIITYLCKRSLGTSLTC